MSFFSIQHKHQDGLPTCWKALENIDHLDSIIEASHHKPQLLFKHSIRCGISSHALHNLLDEWEIRPEKVDAWYLDLINHRTISNAIAEKSGIPHQSPQAILLKDGKVVYHKTHSAIRYKDLAVLLE
jgi:bacillithiol system protein YtxJ